MKKQVSPIVIGGVVAAVIIGVVAMFVLGTTQPEIPAGKKLPGYTEGIPDYVKKAQNGERSAGPGPTKMGDTSNLTPDQRAKIEESMKQAGRR